MSYFWTQVNYCLAGVAIQTYIELLTIEWFFIKLPHVNRKLKKYCYETYISAE